MNKVKKTQKSLIFGMSLMLILIIGLIVFFKIITFGAFNEIATIWNGNISNSFNGGNGTKENPYLISNGEELAYLSNILSGNDAFIYNDKYYELTDDIDMGNLPFPLIGSESFPFKGHFNGNGHTIINITINNSIILNEKKYTGLFSELDSATIENINLSKVTIEAQENANAGIISGIIKNNSNLNNISISDSKISFLNDSSDGAAGGLASQIINSSIVNTYIDTQITNEENIGLVSLSESNSTFSNVLVKSDTTNFFKDNTSVTGINNLSTIPESQLDILNEKLANLDFKWVNDGELYYLTIEKKESVHLPIKPENIELHDSGVFDNIVYVNDLEADYNYYMGLNFTSSTNNQFPSMDNKNLYTDNNLVNVQVTYSSSDNYNSVDYHGTVSLSETQDTYIYYKKYAVNDNGTENDKNDDFIEFELIDNPFTNRPNNRGFNGWKTSYNGATISYDNDIYVRSVKVPIQYNEKNIPIDVIIDFNAVWTVATVENFTSGSNFSTLINNLKSANMYELKTYEPYIERIPIYGDAPNMNNYYRQRRVQRWESISGYYSNTGTLYSYWDTCSTNGGCTVYERQTNAAYDETLTYYELRDGRMQIATIEGPPFIVDYDEIERRTNLYTENDNMSTYFEQVILNNGNSKVGLYSETGVLQTSGTCDSKTCTYYKLLQYYDESGNPNTFNEDKTYYYLVTRDTNFIVLTVNTSSSWNTHQTKPLTITSLYNGIDYDSTWTLSSTYLYANDDLVIENITIYSNTIRSTNSSYYQPPSNNSTRYMFYGGNNNVKFGRGIKKTANNQVNFRTANGGNASATGSENNITKYRFMVESGYFVALNLAGVRASNTVYVDAQAIYGNDYDRVNNNNTNLDVYVRATGAYTSVTVRNDGYESMALHTTVKSGHFGSGGSITNNNSFNYGVYAGSFGSKVHSAVEATIEGGNIFNLVGNAGSNEAGKDYNCTYLYMKGGTINTAVGGAGRVRGYGNRILQVTGGKVNYSIFGGGNGVTSDQDNTAQVNGSSYIYVGGNVQIGDEILYQNESTVYGVEAGNVFGAGNGQNNRTYGSVGNSNIIVDGNAHILRNVFGGGNFAAVGIADYSDSVTTNIKVLNGTIYGNVFGGGNKNGSGSTSITSTINIDIDGGTIAESIYGGANEKGNIYGSVNINVNSGTINNDVYGGGYGGYRSSSNVGTFIRDKVNIKIGSLSSTNQPIINGSVYGGSALGTVNGVSTNITNVSPNGITIKVNNGIIKKAVFGGGKGSTTQTPRVFGNILISIDGGNIGEIYGGNDASGTPLGDININLNNGIVGNVYGGGNQASVTSNQINLKGSTVTTIFGGSNSGGTVTTSNIDTTAGSVANIYGGNNVAGSTINSNVNINGGTISGTVYGGGRLAPTDTTNVNLNATNIKNVFGGGENASVTNATKVLLNGSVVENIYGGSNAGGEISETNIVLEIGTASNIYGGNNAGGEVVQTNIRTSNTSNSEKLKGGNVYGGNNLDGITTNTLINLEAGSYDNIFGGGNQAPINNDTIVNIDGANVALSVYGGGNQADIYGNTIVNISGTSNIGKSVFGGGNHGAIGTIDEDNSQSIVNIAGATIGENVYGGCNTSVVYGLAEVNIGKEAIDSSTLSASNIKIKGTVFGGGEANESGSDKYDFEFISVTKGIEIDINGTDYENNNYEFTISGSIFGSGNASSSSGPSNIYIGKLGTRKRPNTAISIQRADQVTIDDSTIELIGTTDRTNEYSNIKYTFNIIKKLKIKNSTTLLLRQNANMLEEFDSLVDIDGSEVKAAVSINDETKEVTRNVDNRLYLLANNNLNVTTNPKATSYGVVSGMTFLGMYQAYSNGTYVYGMYDSSKNYGDSATAGDVITGGSYVLGLHALEHDITIDGYYSNYIDDDYTELTTAYVEPTPPSSNHYRWAIGIQSINYSFTLTASKYSSLGTYELSMKDFSDGNVTFDVLGFNGDGLTEGIKIKDPNEIPKLALSQEEANSVFGLAMKSETIEWTNSGTTKFYKDESSGFTGDDTYTTDNQPLAPSLMFYLYHAKNISAENELGTVVITLQALKPKNEIEYEIKLITISVTIDARDYNDGDSYDASITYSRKYEMPSATDVHITKKSQFTAYYSLIANTNGVDENGNLKSVNSFYGKDFENYRVLVSNYVLPVGTKITMIDYGVNDDNPNYYYYIIDELAYNNALVQMESSPEVTYKLSNFVKMGSTDPTNTYKDSENNLKYYHESVNHILEEFIFIFDLEDTDIPEAKLDNKITLELRNKEDRTLINVLGIRQSIMIYNLYDESNEVLSENYNIDNNYVYYDIPKNITYSTQIGYDQTELRQTIIDTNYESSSMGINIALYDKSGDQVSSSQLSSSTISFDNSTYYVDSNGVFRIKLADKVSNLNKKLQFTTGNTLPVGTYTMRISLFASSDGLHNSSDKESTIAEFEIIVVGDNNLLLVETDTKNQLIIGETGLNMSDTDSETFNLKYNSVLENPNIRIIAYRRSTDNFLTKDYVEYNIRDLFTNTFNYPLAPLASTSTYEYIISTTPEEQMTLNYHLKDTLKSGTYKIIFRLYDGNQLVEEDYKYIIIRKNV